ncbi:MAG: 5-oxoprolinase, partial [Acidobacteria bacterium]
MAERLGLSPQEAANGIIEIANSNMVGALRLVSVQRGFDPREFMLVAFGGAGPVHANALSVQRGFDPREFMLVAFGGAGPVHANA